MKDILSKIKVGTQFWDGRFGPFTCTKEPEVCMVNDGSDEGYVWTATYKGDITEFLWIEKYSHYGPKIYLQQEYFSAEDIQKGFIK